MGIIVQLFGSLVFLTLVVAGLLLIVVPSLGWRILKKVAPLAGISLLLLTALNIVWNFLRSINPILLILGVAALSIAAYFIREYPKARLSRHDADRHGERIPVMPQHIAPEDE